MNFVSNLFLVISARVTNPGHQPGSPDRLWPHRPIKLLLANGQGSDGDRQCQIFEALLAVLTWSGGPISCSNLRFSRASSQIHPVLSPCHLNVTPMSAQMPRYFFHSNYTMLSKDKYTKVVCFVYETINAKLTFSVRNKKANRKNTSKAKNEKIRCDTRPTIK